MARDERTNRQLLEHLVSEQEGLKRDVKTFKEALGDLKGDHEVTQNALKGLGLHVQEFRNEVDHKFQEFRNEFQDFRHEVDHKFQVLNNDMFQIKTDVSEIKAMLRNGVHVPAD